MDSSFLVRLIPLLRARRARCALVERLQVRGGDKKLPPKIAISPDLFHLVVSFSLAGLSRVDRELSSRGGFR